MLSVNLGQTLPVASSARRPSTTAVVAAVVALVLLVAAAIIFGYLFTKVRQGYRKIRAWMSRQAPPVDKGAGTATP